MVSQGRDPMECRGQGKHSRIEAAARRGGTLEYEKTTSRKRCEGRQRKTRKEETG